MSDKSLQPRFDDTQRPLVINFIPTGMVPTKAMNPNVPISVAEIVEQVHELGSPWCICTPGMEKMLHLPGRQKFMATFLRGFASIAQIWCFALP